MIADRAVALVRPSRRWLVVASLLAHAAVLAAVVSPGYAVERLQWSPQLICISLPAPPPPPSDDHCVLWDRLGDVVACAAYREPARVTPACSAPAVLRAPAPTAEYVPAAQLVRTAGRDITMLEPHDTTARAVVAVCIAPDGAVTWTTPLRSTGDACFDNRLAVQIRAWRYAPLGYAACAQLTFDVGSAP